MRRVTPFDARAYYYHYGAARSAVAIIGAFSPSTLSPFAWYDPSDRSTLFQLSNGTTAVTADGDPVGYLGDKSGNGHHLVMATEANRPLYKTSGGLHWLEFDGSNDFLEVAYGSTIAQPWDRVSAFRRLAALPVGDNDGLLVGPNSFTGQLYITDGGELRIFSGTELGGLAAPAQDADFVVTERHNGASSRVAIDNGSYNTGNAGATGPTGVVMAASTGGTFGQTNCRCYGVVQMDRSLTDPETAQLRTYLGAKQGRSL